ncbi:MAG: Gfo/Idh/MocA family oxidoreductase [Bacteroidaceae bacterium]|nr:Gfo/Idh/MocA family oxidoreductase [Bacteroidaceae bacterium]
MKKTCIAFLLALASVVPACAQEFNWPWHFNGGTIVTDVPERPAGQQPVLGMALPKLTAVRVGFVGLGMRGPDAVERFMHIPGTQVVALCDHEQDRAEACQEILKKYSMPKAAIYYGEAGYEALCQRDDIDLVYVATDWHHHFLVARCALEHGKHVAIEVPSAMSLTECWTLVELSEKYRKHCMILENCCYDEFELNTLNMAQQGLFGDVVRVQGAYIHNLDEYWDAYWKDGENDKLGWRLRYNKNYRGDVYPTHGLGPVAQLLDIHRGDRMKTLVAMDTRSFNGKAWVEKMTGEPCTEFKNGDHTTTLIRTERGKVIEIQHDVLNPQPYNRLYQLTGTRGFANKYPVEGYVMSKETLESHGLTPSRDKISLHSYLPEPDRKAVQEKFMSPILKKYVEKAHEVGGHGGMDFTMDSRLIYCLQNGLPLDMDVYDLAEWCCLAELGAISMDNGFAPVAVPDFTRGNWDKQQGFRHAWASPADEAAAEQAAAEFTRQLKERGAKEWAKEETKKKK